MKYSVITVLLVSAALIGCGSQPETTKNSESQPPTQATPQVRMVEPAANIDLPPATGNRAAPDRSLLERANRNARIDANPNATPAPLVFKPAPENSQIAAAMDPDGTVREVRVFRDHPTLAKAEMTILPNGQRSIKLTLRNGQAAKFPNPAIENLQGVTAAQLLALAGK